MSAVTSPEREAALREAARRRFTNVSTQDNGGIEVLNNPIPPREQEQIPDEIRETPVSVQQPEEPGQ